MQCAKRTYPLSNKDVSERASIWPKLPAVARYGLIATSTTPICLSGFFDSSLPSVGLYILLRHRKCRDMAKAIETRSLRTLTHVLPRIRPVGFPIYFAPLGGSHSLAAAPCACTSGSRRLCGSNRPVRLRSGLGSKVQAVRVNRPYLEKIGVLVILVVAVFRLYSDARFSQPVRIRL